MYGNVINPLILRRDEKKKKRQRKSIVSWLWEVPQTLSILQLKTVCSNLRAFGVRGHIGVFGLHYEADNSRLYVVCAKHVTESQLVNEFSVFGAAQVKLNIDSNGLSKVYIFSNFCFTYAQWCLSCHLSILTATEAKDFPEDFWIISFWSFSRTD